MDKVILSGCIIIKDKSVLLLHRLKHNHYETPGGKVEDCKDPENPTIEELRREAKREVLEELGNIKLSGLKYFGKEEFIEELQKPNKAFIDAIKKGIILFGQEKFVKFMKELRK